ncbi:hypothetical protein MPH_05943 [Macrophomina phaseolina MS6]|uniref:Uncharacterized protein n=1 Tax=Macrophomina phaseolina (strain MS6) TaxID=1126212 RepID=K2SJ22_MACPH|nr:hypothetical protein MPH_05943 [Macrophomina phaseolina MS6]
MEAAYLSQRGFRPDSRRKEGRRGDPSGLRRVPILSCSDWRNLSGPLSGRGETRVRSHLNCVASTGSKVSYIPLPCMTPTRSAVLFFFLENVGTSLSSSSSILSPWEVSWTTSFTFTSASRAPLSTTQAVVPCARCSTRSPSTVPRDGIDASCTHHSGRACLSSGIATLCGGYRSRLSPLCSSASSRH